MGNNQYNQILIWSMNQPKFIVPLLIVAKVANAISIDEGHLTHDVLEQ